MFILELIIWIFKFTISSILQLIQTPFILLSSDPMAEKNQAIKHGLFSIPILTGVWLIFSDHVLIGLILTLGAMVLGSMLIKDDGSL